MGCWNETCGITRLPILAGDKVKVFVLRGGGPARREGGGTCYINDIWSPIGPPISGEYDDYGGVENIVKDKASELTFEAIKENWPKELTGARDIDEVKSFEEMALSDALYYIERDYVHLKGYQGEPERLGLMFILEDVYQALMKYNPIEASFDSKPYVYKPLREIYTESVTDFYTKALKAYKDIKESKDSKDKDHLTFLRIELGMESRLFYDYRDYAGKQFKKALMKAAEKGLKLDGSKAQELITMTVNMFLLYSSMTESRTMWTPQTGKGGQHSDEAVYRVITGVMNQVMDTRQKEYEEENIVEPRDAEGYFPYQRERNKQVADGTIKS